MHMYSVPENIRYLAEKHILPYVVTIRKVAEVAFGIVIIAALLEAIVFNWNYFATINLDTINLKGKIDLLEGSDETFRFSSVDREVEFYNLNTPIQNVYIDFVKSQPAQNLEISIQFTDEAHKTYFDSTEYTVGVPDVQVATNLDSSQYVNLNTTGLVNNMKISIVGEDVQFPIYLNTIELNAHRPFDFNLLRFGIVAFALALIWIFRPGSAIYTIRIVEKATECRVAIALASAIECILLCAFLLYGSNLVGIATSSYNYGSWDGRSLVNVYEAAGDNAQQYAKLAEAIAKGQLYLDEEPPEWLKQMDDPYDKGARDEAQKETGEDYLFDVAYYDGHYYVYFGVVPVLIFYLPFYLATGSGFPTAIGVLLSLIAFVLGCSALLHRFAMYHFKHVSLGLYLLMQIALLTGCGILYLAKFPTFYSLPLACALAFSVWGLYFWMRARISDVRYGWCLAGSICMALVAGCRPQLLALSLLAFPLFWREYITDRRIVTKRGAIEFLCLIGPYIVTAAGIMLYNKARFGSFTDFGANYNLTVNDMTKRGWVLGRLAPAFFAYFIQPPNIVGTFPFVHPVDFSTTYMGQTVREATFGGIFACYPVLWVVLLSRKAIALRNSRHSTKTVSGVIGVLLATGLIVALLDAQMAGILQRYFADFSFMFFATIVLVVFILNEGMHGMISFNLRKTMVSGLGLLVGLGVLYSVLLCFAMETGWYSDVYPWAYQSLVEMFEFWN